MNNLLKDFSSIFYVTIKVKINNNHNIRISHFKRLIIHFKGVFKYLDKFY